MSLIEPRIDPPQQTASASRDALQAVADGIDSCRRGRIDDGAACLFRVLELAHLPADLPASFFSNLGLCSAMVRGKYQQAVIQCKKGIEMEPNEPEGYLLLARVHQHFGSRKLALAAIHAGLKNAPRNPELIALRLRFGVRRKPVLAFLSRDHPLNVVLGRWRHKLGRPPGKKPPRPRKRA